MRRSFWSSALVVLATVVVCVWLSAVALPTAAQEGTPVPSPYTLEDLQALVERAEAAADRADAALEDMAEVEQQAINAMSTANNMFGLFEAMSGAVGIIVPFLAVAAGLLGFRRLESASTELREARERFEQDMAQREAELEVLRDQLQSSAQHQAESAAKATLALSLLPVGDRQYRAQDYPGALDTYRRALDLHPTNPVIHYRMGYVYTQSGELERANQHLTRSLELDPEFAPSQAALGYVFRRQGDKMQPGIERDLTYNRAEEHFLRALNASPKLVDEDGESWWGSLGGLYRRRGQIEQAIHAYEHCADVTPQSSYPFSNLALLYAATHNRARMLDTYKRVEALAWHEVQADVDNYWAYADLIVARLAQGKIKETEAVLDTALQIAPADSPYTLEMLVDTLGRLEAALEPEERPPVNRVIERVRAFQQRQQPSSG